MRIRASNTGDAAAGPGGYANTGVHVGDVYLMPASPVHSGYLHQVRRLAERELLAREHELAEMAAFCQDLSTAGSYWWWRASAWSGKTALMSWFALNPPPGVRVVSFFVTARLAGQSGRTAFIDNVLEQLQAMVGAVSVTETTRATCLLGLLDTAAHACRAAGETLVLLVDGLDEDQGADAVEGEDRSIAALLPMVPPAGMRVIVAGRPNPPLPGDVPEHHPLRSPSVIRVLARSVAAQVAQQDMESELERLLNGPVADRDLLGLLVAGGGGLTGADLAELTGRTRDQVDDQLRAVAGRSFTRQGSRFRSGESPDVYVLGHEELHAAAVVALGEERLDDYRQRLDEWATRYREQGWPPGTPEYLLHGYHSMLVATGDLARSVELSLDLDRHDRMLDISGGDVHAAEEISSLLETLCAENPQDLAVIARLAVRRDYLLHRGLGMPSGLPSVWVALGVPDRAISLARSISVPIDRWRALLSTANALFAIGERDLAVRTVSYLVFEARSEAMRWGGDTHLMEVISALAIAGEVALAMDISRLLGKPGGLRAALLSAAGDLADAGTHEQAMEVLRQAESAKTYLDRSPATLQIELATIARVLAVTGQRRRARQLLRRARRTTIGQDDRDRFTAAFAVVRGLNSLGARRRARTHARKAVQPLMMHASSSPSWMWEPAVVTLVEVGDLVGARALVNRFRNEYSRTVCAKAVAVAFARQEDHRAAADVIARTALSDQSSVWFAVGLALARQGDREGAKSIAARLHLESARTSSSKLSATMILCACGEPSAAEVVAGDIEDAITQAEALAAVAAVRADRREIESARQLVRRAQALALGFVTLDRHADAYSAVAEALVVTGDVVAARTIASRLPEALQRARVVRAEIEAGVADADAPARLLDLHKTARSIPELGPTLAWAAEALAQAGDTGRANDLFDSAEAKAGWSSMREDECVPLTLALVRCGQPERAVNIVLQYRVQAWRPLHEALLAAGEHALAQRLVREVASTDGRGLWAEERMELRASLVAPLVAMGDIDQARRVVSGVLEYLDEAPEPRLDGIHLANLISGVLELLDLEEARDIVDRVQMRIGRGASSVECLDQSRLAKPLAAAMMRRGDVSAAIELTRTLVPSQRPDVLMQIAATLLHDGDVLTARPLVAEALRSGEDLVWGKLVAELGKFIPDVVAAVGSEVLRLSSQG